MTITRGRLCGFPLRAALRESCSYALFFAGVLAIANEAGADYSWQVSGGAQQLETGDSVGVDGTVLEASYYFRPVDEGRGPYALATFLNRSSRVTAALHRDEQTQMISYSIFEPPVATTFARKTEGSSISGRYVWRTSGWYAGGGLSSADTDVPPSLLSETDIDLESVSAAVGKYLGDSTSLELTWRSAESDTNVTRSCIRCPQLLGTEVETDDIGVAVLHVGDLGAFTYALSGRVLESRSDITLVRAVLRPAPGLGVRPPIIGVVIPANPIENPVPFNEYRSYSLGGELFPTPRLGVRLGYLRWDGDSLRDYGYDLSTTWFFTRSAAVSFTYARTDLDLFGASNMATEDTLAVRLMGRF